LLLVVTFLGGLAIIEINRQGLLPEVLAQRVSHSHFDALHLAFTLLLVSEVIGLVLGLARSVANAVGKQLEIMSLILIRQSFKDLSALPEPIGEAQIASVLPNIISDAVGALLIFIVLGLYYRLQRHQPFTRDSGECSSFVAIKKLIALLLLATLAIIGVRSVWQSASGQSRYPFFEVFYTLLIFADVLIVLISMAYSTAYHVLFRYFGFAVATILVRLALSAPRMVDAALGLGASLFALALTWAYNLAAHEITAGDAASAVTSDAEGS
jgi:hypothetical protein